MAHQGVNRKLGKKIDFKRKYHLKPRKKDQKSPGVLKICQQSKGARKKSLGDILEQEGITLGKKIGYGSYSTVNLATVNGKKMACKIVDKKTCSRNFILQFLPRELEIIKKLRHPNIAKCLIAKEVQGFMLFFLEYCEHGDIADYIYKEGALSESMAKHFFKQVASAVEYLHEHDIAHRDIKCDNILLARGFSAKLADFSLSKLCDDNLSNTFCGSPEYAAPEIHLRCPYDPKLVDLWAMGCVLYTMLTANIPFPQLIVFGVPKNLRFFNLTSKLRTISLGATQIIKSLMEPVAEKRLPLYKLTSLPWLRSDKLIL